MVPDTAQAVVAELEALATSTELARVRKRLPPGEPALGIRMRFLFEVAKSATSLSLEELDRLMAERAYEPRLAAFCILDFKARKDVGSDVLRERYLHHHDRITTWDMVDRAAPRVLGSAVSGGPYDVLHDLAAATDPLRRRSAITAPLWFARYSEDPDDLAAGFVIAGHLCGDPDPIVHKAAAIFLAHAGKRDPGALERFLAEHSAAMPAPARRLATRLMGDAW